MSLIQKLHLIPPNENQLANIHKELFEDADKLANHMQLLKKWIECEGYLPTNVDDSVLENFIRLSKYNLDRAKKKFEMYIIVRSDLLKSNVQLTNYDFEETDLGRLFLILPNLTSEGYRVLYGIPYERVDGWDINKVLTYCLNVCEVLLHSDMNAGYVFLFNFETFTFSFMSKLDMPRVKAFFNLMFNIQPARIRRFHIINLSAVGKTFVTILKSLMSEKMKNRIIIHSDQTELLDYFEKDFLPPEIGGSGKSVPETVTQWKEYLIDNEDLKKRNQTMALRQPIPKSKAHLDPSSGFGVEGSFRKIQLD